MNTFLSSLRLRVILIALIALLPAWAMMLFSISRQRAIIESDVMKESLRTAELAASNEEQAIEGIRQVLTILDIFFHTNLMTPRECSGFLKQVAGKFGHYANLGAVNRRGDVLCSAHPEQDTLNVADSPWFQRAIQSKQSAAGDYQIARVTAKPVLMVARPGISFEDRVQTVLFAAIDLEWLHDFHVPKRAESIEGAFLALADRNGMILPPHPKSLREVPALPNETLLEAISRGGSTKVLTAKDSRGVEYVCAVSPIQSRSSSRAFNVVLGIPGDGAFAEANRSRNINLLLLGGVSILMLAVFWMAANSTILGRLSALFSAARGLAAGDLKARSGLVHQVDEVGRFTKAFDEITQALELREREHREAEGRIRSSEEQLRRLQTHIRQVREEERLRLAL